MVKSGRLFVDKLKNKRIRFCKKNILIKKVGGNDDETW